jgi:hypothetical protein
LVVRGIVENRIGVAMIANDQELQVTRGRVVRLQAQVSHLRRVEMNAANYRATNSGSLAEIDRMQLEVREYLGTHTADIVITVV